MSTNSGVRGVWWGRARRGCARATALGASAALVVLFSPADAGGAEVAAAGVGADPGADAGPGADAAAPAAPGADALQDVVIAATGLPTPELEVGSSITVVTADEIAARQARTFADVLADIPGLNVVRQGGPGGVTSVFMRGTNSNHIKVLVDGIDVGDPSNLTGAFDFGQLLTADIERVEVLRGPQSGLYGSDAVGGVIDIITRAGSGPARLAAAAEGGSFDTFNQSGSLSGSHEGFNYRTSVDHFHAGATPVTPLALLEAGEHRNDDSDDDLIASGKYGLDLTPGFDLGLVARYTNTHLRTTGDDFSPLPPFQSFPATQQTRTDTSEYYARGTAHLVSAAGGLDQTLGLAWTHSRTGTLEPASAEALNTGSRIKADWQAALRLVPAATVLFGLEDARDEINAPISAADRIESGWLELQGHLGERWSAAANARYDHHDRFGGKATWRFAPAWVNELSGTKLKASVGTGFKAPTLSELYQSFPAFFFFANPDLRPESSLGYDFGAEQGFGRGASGVAGHSVGAAGHDAADSAGTDMASDPGTLRIGATWFHNRIRDLIAAAPFSDPMTGAAGTTEVNIGRASTQGIESFVSWAPLAVLTLRLDYTYTEATDDESDEELLRRPKHKGSLHVTWRATSALLVDASVLSVGSWVDGNRDFSIPRLRAPGYTTADLAASFDLTPHVALFGRVENLLGRHYQNPVGFLQPGFGVFAGVRLKTR